MTFRPGPVFANLLLADEINRATPKTQSALLEAMAEMQVTVGGETHKLQEPFLVVATQNPIEQEGTYPLPEAQLDRFMMEIHIDYPTPEQEERIVLTTSGAAPPLPTPVFDRAAFLELRELTWSVPIPRTVAAYAVKLCGASRPTDPRATKFVKDYVGWGAGPRGSQNLVRAARRGPFWKGGQRRRCRTFAPSPGRCCGIESSPIIARSAMGSGRIESSSNCWRISARKVPSPRPSPRVLGEGVRESDFKRGL